jgi:hypothetical protein
MARDKPRAIVEENEMAELRHFPFALISLLAALMASSLAAQTSASSSPAVLSVANATIPTRVLSQSPADTVTDLQIICLFHSDPSNTLHGALIETNEKLKGLLDRVRKPGLFAGDLGETLLITPPAGTLAAKKLLIIGLGDSQTFAPERMQLVGAIAYRESNRIGIVHPFFAPTVIDGGVTKFTTGEIAGQFIRGFLRAAATEREIGKTGYSAGVTVVDLTYLAGVKFALITHDGLAAGFAAEAARKSDAK